MSLWVLPRPKCIRGERGLVEITHLVDFTLPFGSGEASGAPPPPGRRLILNEVISDAVDNPEFWQARWSVAADGRGSDFRERQGLPRLPDLEFAIYEKARPEKAAAALAAALLALGQSPARPTI